jgi:SSS family transporter
MNYVHWVDYAVIVIYMLAVIGIGVYFSRKEKSSEDYLLGGRNMPYMAIGLSCMMSLLSSVSIVVIPGEIYNNGLTLFSLSSIIGIIMVVPCYLLFVRFYFKLGSFTPFEYLEYRYSSTVRSLVAISCFYTRTLYLGAVLFSTSKIFEGAYNWPAWLTILLVGGVGTLYTIMGGMKAVVWSDVMQFVVLAVGFIVFVVVLCGKIDGGAYGAVAYAFEQGHGLSEYRTADFYKISPYVRLCFWLLLFNAITSPLTRACSDQINIQRLLSTKDWKTGLKSQIVATCTSFPFIVVIWFVGLGLFSYYHQHPNPTLKSGDGILFHFIANYLPTPMPGIFMAAMLAAIMSTLDSGINSMSTIWLKEIHQRYINRKLNGEQEVTILRRATFIIGIVAMGLGLLLHGSGKWLAQSAAEIGVLFSLFSAIILPAFLFAVLSPRANSKLIWLLMLYSIGDGVAMKIWYTMSRITKQAWQTGEALSWAGPISCYFALIPLLAGGFCIGLWFILNQIIPRKYALAILMFGVFLAGIAQGMCTWVLFSNTLIGDSPMARSFAFGLPTTLAIGFIALYFCPKQPREKYQGLTIATINEPILSRACPRNRNLGRGSGR